MIEGKKLLFEISLRRFSKIASVLTVAVGLLVLFGWARDFTTLKSVLPGLVTMKANAALSFVFCGTALWLLSGFSLPRTSGEGDVKPGFHIWIARACAAIVGLIALLTLSEYAFGWELGIDQILFQDNVTAIASHPGRVAPMTAFNFIVLATALLSMDIETHSGHRPAQWLVIAVAISGFLAILGYMYGVESLYRVFPFTSVALHTALLFVLISLGFLCARPDRGLMILATGDDAGGLTIRRLLPATILLPPTFGYLRLVGEREGFYTFAFGLALFVTSNVLVFSALAWWNARVVHNLDAKRLKALHQLEHKTGELSQAVEALARSNAELQQFAYIASHDLQTPLRSISGFVQLLQSEYEGKLDEQADDWIRRTVQSIKQMQILIRDVLAYSGIDARSRPFQQTNVGDVFNGAVATLESAIRDSNAQVTCDELPIVMGDSSQLMQLMQNLIENALKYHGADPPRVHVSAAQSGSEWTFSVRDNGIGIDPKHHEKIFQIFRRLHDQQEFPGTGIGLAICHRVVHHHGGKIWVESQFGQGSVFHFTIPERTGSEP